MARMICFGGLHEDRGKTEEIFGSGFFELVAKTVHRNSFQQCFSA